MANKELDDYIDSSINGDAPSWFDPNGNSDCAVVMRMRKGGLLAALKWEVPQAWRAIKDSFADFDGLNTSIGWFIWLILLPFISPFLPLLSTYLRYRSAIKNYEREFNDNKKRKEVANGND